MGTLLAGSLLLCGHSLSAVPIRVGPKRAIKTIAFAAYSARAGAIIYVDSGTYTSDVAVWTQDNITVRAVGGRVRLLANGAAAEGKGIWVVRAKGCLLYTSRCV